MAFSFLEPGRLVRSIYVHRMSSAFTNQGEVMPTWDRLLEMLENMKEKVKATHVAFDATTASEDGSKRVFVEPIDDVIRFVRANRVE